MIDLSLFPILDKFDSLTWRADDPNLGQCKCPAHDDRTESLHVTLKEDELGNPKILLLCHAGCETGAILRAIHEPFSSLFPDRTRHKKAFVPHSAHQKSPIAQSASSSSSPSTEPKLVKVYSYRDAKGKVLHQTLRWEPKNFTQRRAADPHKVYTFGKQEAKSFKDPHGNWWINSLKGIEPVPYNLPEILSAPLNRIIFLCEGEKDAENLQQAFGCLTTTVPMGTGKWRPSYSEHFRGRRIVIIPDMDKPRKGQVDPMANAGVDGAKKIAKELVEIAAEVRILYLSDFDGKLTPKWDLSDWLSAGGTKQQFGEALSASPVLTVGDPLLLPAGMSAADYERNLSIAAAELAKSGQSDLLTEQKHEFGRPLRTQLLNFIDGNGGEHEAQGVRAILATFQIHLDGWPKRVGQSLFYVDRDKDPQATHYPVQWLKNASSLFGWASRYTGHPVGWASGPGMVTKQELFEEMSLTAEEFDSVEKFPHHPRVPEVHYACKEEWKSLKPGCLLDLIARFSPAEAIDYELMMAFFATLVWGGPGGQRPMFVITADSGRGAGKTTFATLAASLVGGSLDFSSNADDVIVRKRLLSPEGRDKRVVIIDNVKTHKFSCAELEALITSPRVSGQQMYVGEGSRANRITYIATMNAPSFSRDLAQRSVVIKLGAPVHSGNWAAETAHFIATHRESLIAEMLEFLATSRKTDLKRNTRWGQWENEVLSCLSSAEECQLAILKRQRDLDADKDEASIITEAFRRQLNANGQNASVYKVFITRATAAAWLNKALGTRFEVPSACRILNQKINEGDCPEIERTAGGEVAGRPGDNTRERGYWWIPQDWDGDSVVKAGDFQTHDLDDEFLFQSDGKSEGKPF